MKKILTIALALSALGMVIGGCSSAEEPKTDTTATTPAPEEGK